MKKIILSIICSLVFLSAGTAQWQRVTNGLYGGYTGAITVDPTTNYIYIGSVEASIYQQIMEAIG